MWKTNKIKKFLLDIIFPQFCVLCAREGYCVCPDCLSAVSILEHQFCPVCGTRCFKRNICKNCAKKTNLSGVFSAAPYSDYVVKKSLSFLKYEPYIKDLSNILADLIITHFHILDNNRANQALNKAILIPVPLSKQKMKIRNFNQSEEITKHIAARLKLQLANNVLIKTKPTLSQVGLPLRQRKENIIDSFACANPGAIKNKKIMLVDDVFTTGSTLEECARVLKSAGAKEIYAATAAREF